MIDSRKIQTTHPLYEQFADWQGVDGYLDNAYHMVNYSLHAATQYMESVLGIDLYLSNKNLLTTTLPTTSYTKLLNAYDTTGLLLPNVTYTDTSTGQLVIDTQGEYDSTSILTKQSTYANVVLGYVFETAIDYNEAEYLDQADRPKLTLSNGVPVSSPYVVNSVSTTLDIVVTGKVNYKVEVNEVEVGVIGADCTVSTQLTLNASATSFRIKLIDPITEQASKVKYLLVAKIPNYVEDTQFTLLGYEQVTNTNKIKLLVSAKVGSIVTINTTDFAITTPVQALEYTALNTDNNSNINTVQVLTYKSGNYKGIVTAQYNSTLSTDYVEAVNKDVFSIPYLPYDLQVAMFKLAKHLYSGTLYNSANVETSQNLLGEKVSYVSHRIPKDVTALLSAYIRY